MAYQLIYLTDLEWLSLLILPTPLPTSHFQPMALLSTLASYWASLVAQSVKNLPAMQETSVQSLGQEDQPMDLLSILTRETC